MTMTQANSCGGFECKSNVAVHCIGDWTSCVQRALLGEERGLIEPSERTLYRVFIHWSVVCEIQHMHGTG